MRVPAARPRAGSRLPRPQRPRARVGGRERRAAGRRSAGSIPPKARSPRANAAWPPAPAGIKLHPRAQDFVFDSEEMHEIFKLAEDARVPILIHAGRGLPPLAEGLVDLALRHPGAVLILAHGAICDQGILTTRLADHPGVLYDISCFFPLDVIELFARVPRRADRVRLRPALRAAGDDPLHGAAGRPAGRAGRGRHAGPARRDDGEPARRTRAARTTSRVQRGSTITLSGRLARVYGYASLVGPALFTGALEQARAMLDMAVAACRDPEPADVGEALETIGRRCRRPTSCSAAEDGVRPAIDLVYRSNVLAATALPGLVRQRPARRPPATGLPARCPRCAARGAHPEARRERRRRPRSASPTQQPRGDQLPRRAIAASSGELEQQAAQQVADHDGRSCGALAGPRRVAPARRAGRPRGRRAATSLTTAFWRAACTLRGSLSSAITGRVAELGGHDREHPRAAADVEQGRPPAGARTASSSSSSRHSRVVAWAPVPNAWPGSITISCGAGAEGARGLPRRADADRRPGRVRRRRASGAAIRTGR